ncbi:4-carboxy-4-hydroxy-2-oxoadipate aldolase/oxaloacetate decarboxylase [Paenarthrobacter sp. NPDC091711]|uniref:4-carboxy-4-hydroxy-2-oxoadipate aldolase/oxaloacetate decarboxylase n=1 Tax=Micrococcaceae TaxID=1268 RepID=UPI00089BB757|nr:4-carboxy-4-hydroxy-2-oxoadipate aldolase/oxaloacetate decarboxylase [Arthrobacter sp. cf158]SDX49115.1 4-hydroxy-4-methyl-2-oxoglutarate aldolase [Arthrobacter sp. cf158]
MILNQTTDPRMTKLAGLGAATVYEANGQRDAIDPAIKPLDPTSRVAGRVVTVDLEPGDNWFIHVALLEAGEGDILVVDAKGYVQAGPWGDVLTLAAQERGVAALVIDGAVRDSQEIIASGFPVFTRGVCIRKTTKVQKGRVNVPVTIGGVLINPGDILVGDADGLVRVGQNDVDTALASSEQRELKEETMRARIREGASTLDLLGLTRP